MSRQLEYLYGLQLFGVKLGLERMVGLVEKLGNPQKKFKVIHVAGTNGKGSTCAFLESVLREAEYKIGLYTSPHLIRFNERIKVNGNEISDVELDNLIRGIRDVLGDADETTFFEFTTAIALLYFAQQEVDVAVIEVGLGGRLDATNVVDPLVSVVTNIGLDHTNILGEKIEKIAVEKGGIVKQGIPVVANASGKAKDVLDKICTEKECKLYLVGKEKLVSSDLEGQCFSYHSVGYEISLLGEHQISNACTAVEVLNIISKDFPVSNEVIKKGLLNTQWQGRLEVICKEPLIIVDGAHNGQGMVRVADFISTIPLEKRKILVLGISQKKDVGRIVKSIVPLFDTIVITQASYKPEDTQVIAAAVEKYTDKYHIMENYEHAFWYAQEMIEKEEMLLVTGSLYLVGDILKLFEKGMSI